MKKSLIYTRSGDKGETSLFGGTRVKKFAKRIKAIGALDELNAVLGLTATKTDPQISKLIEKIQNELFTIGAVLANPDGQEDRQGNTLAINEVWINFLEAKIDEIDSTLQPLQNFILPGGCETASLFHFARTICRRAERKVVKLAEKEKVDPILQKYLNRLSDLLFVLARNENKKKGVKEKEWQK
jgi:cob(I)alamin adenosyltransferase